MTLPDYPAGVYRRPGTATTARPLPAAPPPPRSHTERAVDQFMTVEEVATAWRVSKMTVYRLIHAGDLRASKFGRSFRVSVRDFDAFRRNAFVVE